MVEVALLISLLGVVLAVGVPAFSRSLRTSKMAEAPFELSRIHMRLAAYYRTPQPTASGKRLRCLPGPAGPTPNQPSREPLTVVFGAADAPGSAVWRAIGYEPSGPIRYRYAIVTSATGCGVGPAKGSVESVLTLRAEGDLDADGKLSRFERRVGTRDGELVLDPMLEVHDRIE
jgi:hypothetical protein